MTDTTTEPIEGELLPIDVKTLKPYSEEARGADGRFKPGYSGNYAGRTKGIRNKITLDRLLVEDVLRTAIAHKSPELIQKALDMALEGNDRVMRVLLDKLLSTPKHDDPTDAKDNSVKVVIQNLTAEAKNRLVGGGETPVVSITSNQPPQDDEHGS